jgi:hypothetical protein
VRVKGDRVVAGTEQAATCQAESQRVQGNKGRWKARVAGGDGEAGGGGVWGSLREGQGKR